MAEAVADCKGAIYQRDPARSGADFRIRDAEEIAQSLPRPGETAVGLNDSRANDIYEMAGALLKPAIPNPERAFDPSVFVKCATNPEIGVAILAFLTAGGPGRSKGTGNAFYWLGQASRRGIGVPADPARARLYFLQARMLGIFTLTAEDWGEKPSDTLLAILARQANRAMLEDAAAAGRPDAQLLLGELLVPTDKARARLMLEAAVAKDAFRAARKLAALEMQGALGKADPARAVALLAPKAYPGSDAYREMLAAAEAYNAGDIPILQRPLTLSKLGGPSLIPWPDQVEFDGVPGRVPARALIGPDGKIVFTEVIDPRTRQFRMAKVTLRIFDPKKLKPGSPHVEAGRPVFAWAMLPPIIWRGAAIQP